MTVRCHYEVLGIEQTADASTIKKAHRKLALKYHPDKNTEESATEEFRYVQQAYECLSDPTERRWYDEHREAILNNISTEESSLFDIIPYMYAGCYQQYSDAEGDFYAVYRSVFTRISSEEANDLSGDFGNRKSDWDHVGMFYQQWESFSSSSSFAWVDEYDPFAIKEAPSRWVRRKMTDDNKKARKAAQKQRNNEILALVRFVKRRDPRVKARQQQQHAEREAQAAHRKAESLRKKQQAKELRQEWLEQQQEEDEEQEEIDRLAGRVRLADLEDDYDYGGKRGRKGKGKRKEESSSSEDEELIVNDGDELSQESVSQSSSKLEEAMSVPDSESYEESSSDESSEPDVWRCEACRKDFKSQGQMDNHLKSKKHKEAVKKQKK